MSPFADTSFLCALYRSQVNSEGAIKWMERLEGSVAISALVVVEFKQSTRLQTHLNKLDRSKGFSEMEGTAMLRDFQADLNERVIEVIPVDWAETHHLAEMLSAKHTRVSGYRLLDILHVASALQAGKKDFWTLDARQKSLAEAEGLMVPG